MSPFEKEMLSRLENNMSTPERRALHYVELYALMYPDSGADEVARELWELIDKKSGGYSAPTPGAETHYVGLSEEQIGRLVAGSKTARSE